jgi:hypothetical protein
MTASFAPQPVPARSGANPVVAVAVVLLAAVAFMTLITAGFTFLGFAIAFPIAVPIAEYFNVAFTSVDAAVAEAAAGFWWAFAALAVASFGAAAVVVVAAIKALTPPSN